MTCQLGVLRSVTYALPVTSDTKPLPKQHKRSPHALPWIVVGIVVIIALIVSTLLVRNLRSNTDDEATKPDNSSSNSQPSPDDSEDDEEEPAEPEVPDVEVGQTFPLRITQWGTQVQISQKFGGVWYELSGDPVAAHLSAPIIDQLPEECAEMRTQFGFTQNSDGALGVMKPDAKCDADPQLYNEIWGLLDAAAATAEAL